MGDELNVYLESERETSVWFVGDRDRYLKLVRSLVDPFGW